MTSSVDEHLAALYRLRRFGIKFGLAAISRLLQGLGNPQKHFSCIHVAGTNGKGSIAAFLSSILDRAGYKVGLYTSPHLVRFNERIQINGRPIPDEDLRQVLEAVQRIYMQGEPPTFFECATAMALHYFSMKKVDWAVIETGMGGRYDATNVVQSEISVISNIGMEHEAYLGDTIAKIAREKAGIIKQNAGAVTGVRQKEALQVIQDVARKIGAPLYRLGKEFRIRKDKEGRFSYFGIMHHWPRVSIGLLGDHQRTNAALALAAVELLLQKGIPVSREAIYDGLARANWPGRLEVHSTQPWVLMDGAHNPPAVRTLKKFLDKWRASGRLIMVIGILEDKRWKAMLRDLSGSADVIIITKPSYERAADPHELASWVRHLKKDPIVIPHLPDALVRALKEAGPGDAVCITGSLYTVGDAKAYLQGPHAPR